MDLCSLGALTIELNFTFENISLAGAVSVGDLTRGEDHLHAIAVAEVRSVW